MHEKLNDGSGWEARDDLALVGARTAAGSRRAKGEVTCLERREHPLERLQRLEPRRPAWVLAEEVRHCLLELVMDTQSVVLMATVAVGGSATLTSAEIMAQWLVLLTLARPSDFL